MPEPRCDRSDLPVSQCAHCQGHVADWEQPTDPMSDLIDQPREATQMTQPTTSAAEEFLTQSGGAKSFSFAGTPPLTAQGVICEEPRKVQATDYDPKGGRGDLKFYPSGDPIMELLVILQTDLRDDAEDDGRRAVYIGGRASDPTSKHGATAAACKAAGAFLAKGGTFALQYYARPNVPGTDNPPKQYRAEYRPPASDAESLLGGAPAQEPQAPASAPAAAPATQPLAQPAPAPQGGLLGAPAAPPPAPAGAVTPAGVDPGVLAGIKAVRAAGQPIEVAKSVYGGKGDSGVDAAIVAVYNDQPGY